MRTYTKTRKEKPYSSPETEREELQNILWGIGVAIPYSEAPDPHHPFYMELSELRDMVQWQMEKVAGEPEFRKGHITDEAREGYREYARWRDRRDMGVLSYSVPGIPGLSNG
jgi:hypothetical protein